MRDTTADLSPSLIKTGNNGPMAISQHYRQIHDPPAILTTFCKYLLIYSKHKKQNTLYILSNMFWKSIYLFIL